jgi:chromosome segregation ATPase
MKLTKKQQAEKADHAQTIRKKHEALEQAVAAYNTAMREQRAKVEEALNDLNGAITDAESWREEIANAQEEYYDNKSEKWQEGDKGNAYSSWKDEWGNEFEQMEEIEFPELEVPECDLPDTIENLNDQPEE